MKVGYLATFLEHPHIYETTACSESLAVFQFVDVVDGEVMFNFAEHCTFYGPKSSLLLRLLGAK